MKKRTMTLVVSLLLVALVAVGGTLAWLTATSGEVKNTFTAGDINIDLYETTAGTKVMSKEYKMVPGTVLDKDPTVEVIAGSEACWVFVKVGKNATVDTYLSYEMADGWVELDAEKYPGVYYYNEVVNVLDAENNKEIQVLKDSIVTVNGDVTKDMLDDLTDANKPELTFVAYASQVANGDNTFTAEEAWNNIEK